MCFLSQVISYIRRSVVTENDRRHRRLASYLRRLNFVQELYFSSNDQVFETSRNGTLFKRVHFYYHLVYILFVSFKFIMFV